MINNSVPLLKVYLDGEEDLKRDFRLSGNAINNLMALLDIRKTHGREPQLEIVLFVKWLAHRASYLVVSHAFAVPKPSIFHAVHKVTDKTVSTRKHCIHDGCHIRIKAPSGPASADYINRKLFHAIQLQAICDSDGKFWVHLPGTQDLSTTPES